MGKALDQGAEETLAGILMTTYQKTLSAKGHQGNELMGRSPKTAVTAEVAKLAVTIIYQANGKRPRRGDEGGKKVSPNWLLRVSGSLLRTMTGRVADWNDSTRWLVITTLALDMRSGK